MERRGTERKRGEESERKRQREGEKERERERNMIFVSEYGVGDK